MIEGSSKFMSGRSSRYINTLPSLVAIGNVVADMFLFCHMIKQDHMIKRSSGYNDRGPTRSVNTLPSLVVISIAAVEMHWF